MSVSSELNRTFILDESNSALVAPAVVDSVDSPSPDDSGLDDSPHGSVDENRTDDKVRRRTITVSNSPSKKALEIIERNRHLDQAELIDLLRRQLTDLFTEAHKLNIPALRHSQVFASNEKSSNVFEEAKKQFVQLPSSDEVTAQQQVDDGLFLDNSCESGRVEILTRERDNAKTQMHAQMAMLRNAQAQCESMRSKGEVYESELEAMDETIASQKSVLDVMSKRHEDLLQEATETCEDADAYYHHVASENLKRIELLTCENRRLELAETSKLAEIESLKVANDDLHVIASELLNKHGANLDAEAAAFAAQSPVPSMPTLDFDGVSPVVQNGLSFDLDSIHPIPALVESTSMEETTEVPPTPVINGPSVEGFSPLASGDDDTF